MFKLFESKKHRLAIIVVVAVLALAFSVATVLATTVGFAPAPITGAGSGGGGVFGEIGPRGFSVLFNEASGDYAAGDHEWLSSKYNNTCWLPIYTGVLNGVDYINPDVSVTFYVWVDKNPTAAGNVETNKQYIELYQDGVSYKDIDGLNLVIGSPARDGFLDPSGQISSRWYIPMTVTGMTAGHDYSFALLRGLRTNNDQTLVLVEDYAGTAVGYLSGMAGATPAEEALFAAHRLEEYQYRSYAYTYDGVTVGESIAPYPGGVHPVTKQPFMPPFYPTNDEGNFHEFRFSFSTKVAGEIPVYDITFSVTPSSAALVVKDSAGAAMTATAGVYKLEAGTYSYTAVANTYKNAAGTFTVDGNANINITMYRAYGQQGFNQFFVLYTPNTNSPYPVEDISVLRIALNAVTEGMEYYLNRIENIYDISGGKNVQIQNRFDSGMNAWSVNAWKTNGMRYLTLIDAATGEVVANWRDETPDANGKNSTGKYQIGYGTVGEWQANQAGIIYTIPNAAFEYNSTYYLVNGSATCGNNNQKQLYVPVIFQFTTGDASGNGTVDINPNPLLINPITVNVIKAANDLVSALNFNRYTGSGYAIGAPIARSIVGQEIALKETIGGGLTLSMRVTDANGLPVPMNGYVGVGGNANNYGDNRFTMPNSAVTVNAVFGYNIGFDLKDTLGETLTGVELIVSDSARTYFAEANGSYVLPAGSYQYSIKKAGKEIDFGNFSVTANNTITLVVAVSVVEMGDIDGNGKINIFDLQQVLNHIYGLGTPLSGDALTAADMDGNGKVNIFDLQKILNIIYGIA